MLVGTQQPTLSHVSLQYITVCCSMRHLFDTETCGLMFAKQQMHATHEHLCANWLHAFNLLQPLPLFLFPQKGQQATETFLALGMIQFIQIVVPVVQAKPW